MIICWVTVENMWRHFKQRIILIWNHDFHSWGEDAQCLMNFPNGSIYGPANVQVCQSYIWISSSLLIPWQLKRKGKHIIKAYFYFIKAVLKSSYLFNLEKIIISHNLPLNCNGIYFPPHHNFIYITSFFSIHFLPWNPDLSIAFQSLSSMCERCTWEWKTNVKLSIIGN